MKRPIAIGLAPNLEKVDADAALQLLFSPKKILRENQNEKLAEWFRNYFSTTFAFPFSSARGGITALLQSKGIGKGDEVMLQAFTCVAVSNAILATGATPIYVDVTDTFTIDLKDLKKKVTSHTKAVILQHTFGIPAYTDELESFLHEKDYFVIEDVAHTIGGVYKGKKLGTVADAAVFSFGRDKAFSSVSGGIVITNNKQVGREIEKVYQQAAYPSALWTFQQLFHSVSFFYLILPMYNFFLGKAFLVLSQKLHLLAKPVAKDELQNYQQFMNKLPPQLSYLTLLQVRRLDKFNTYREETGDYYAQELASMGGEKYSGVPLLRYPLLVKNPLRLRRYAKKRGILLGDWYAHVIDPKETNLSQAGYRKDCPHAEYIAAHMINLPTYPTLTRKEREKIVKILKEYGKN